MKKLKNLFPYFGNRNILIYYLLGIFLNGWFIMPNWVFYFLRHLSLKEVGIVEGVAVIVGIVMEIPSGAIADLFGKRKTILFGSLCIIVACLILIGARDFWSFLIGNSMMFVGFSFHSGATEAFAYDSLLEKKQEKNYDLVAARHGVISTILMVVSTFFGGLLYAIRPEYTFYAWIVFLSVASVLSYISTEPIIDSDKFSVKNYFLKLGDGARVLFGEKLRKYIVPLLGIPILIKLYQGLVRQSSGAYFGYNGETFGYLLSFVMIPAVLISYNFDRVLRIFKERKLLLITLGLYGSAFALAYSAKIPVAGAVVFFILMGTEKIAQPLVSLIANQHIESRHRATTLSTISLISQIPYVLLVLKFSEMTEVKNIPILYLIYLGFIAFVFGWTYFVKDNPNEKQ